MEFTKDVLIAKPLDEVAALLADPAHPLQWQPALQAITPLKGTPGAVGSTAAFEYDFKGREFQLEETIVASDLPRSAQATYTASGLVHTISTTLTAEGPSSTRVEFDNAMKFSGMMKLMGPMIGAKLKEQAEESIESFRHWAETGDAVSRG